MAYDVETFWECNQDNEPDFPNRCQEVDSEHLLVKIKKESIQRLLNAYNYQAALLLAQEISEFISPRTMPVAFNWTNGATKKRFRGWLFHGFRCKREIKGRYLSMYSVCTSSLPREITQILFEG